jgi:polyisoprenoid-binding protein YceI
MNGPFATMRNAAGALVLCSFMVSAPAAADDVTRDATIAPAGAYHLAASHSQILFSIGHIGLNRFYGRFDRVSGDLAFDPSQLAQSRVSVSVDTSSVDTPSASINNELAGPDVFDSREFKSASFVSRSVAKTGMNTGQITGDLTIRDKTCPVVLDVVFNGARKNPLTGRDVLGFHATASIRRSDYGLTGMIWEPLVSDDVQLVIEAMFEKEKKQ